MPGSTPDPRFTDPAVVRPGRADPLHLAGVRAGVAERYTRTAQTRLALTGLRGSNPLLGTQVIGRSEFLRRPIRGRLSEPVGFGEPSAFPGFDVFAIVTWRRSPATRATLLRHGASLTRHRASLHRHEASLPRATHQPAKPYPGQRGEQASLPDTSLRRLNREDAPPTQGLAHRPQGTAHPPQGLAPGATHQPAKPCPGQRAQQASLPDTSLRPLPREDAPPTRSLAHPLRSFAS